MKKPIIVVIVILIIIVCFFAFNPFYWGMQSRHPLTLQPEISKIESDFMIRLEKKCDCKVERAFHNYKKEAEDSIEIKKYDQNSFYYSLNLSGANKEKLDISESGTYKIAKFVKDSILLKDKNLKSIEIWKNYNIEKSGGMEQVTYGYNYSYILEKDTLIGDVSNGR
jgi:hypothetical protein